MSPIVGMLGLAIFEPALWNCLIAYLFCGSVYLGLRLPVITAWVEVVLLRMCRMGREPQTVSTYFLCKEPNGSSFKDCGPYSSEVLNGAVVALKQPQTTRK